jgi:hypothetical protein
MIKLRPPCVIFTKLRNGILNYNMHMNYANSNLIIFNPTKVIWGQVNDLKTILSTLASINLNNEDRIFVNISHTKSIFTFLFYLLLIYLFCNRKVMNWMYGFKFVASVIFFIYIFFFEENVIRQISAIFRFCVNR